MTLSYLFNRTPLKYGEAITDIDVSDEWLIEGAPNLRRASLENAVLFGGPVVRRALEAAPLKGDRKYVIVDTKSSMLMPGWYPAIPGWHTDGVPRGPELDPSGSGEPSLAAQANQSACGYSPRYHTIIFGNPCLTEFVTTPAVLDLEHGESSELYSEITRVVNSGLKAYGVPNRDTVDTDRPAAGQWVSWDWWQLHTATEATQRGWRLLIRVTESDNILPAESKFIRAQNQVYVPTEFGW